MKRLLTLAAMFLCSLLTFAQFSGSGSGTESDPFLIFNPIQLNQLRNYLNKSGVYFKLMADIDLAEFLEDENPSQGWQPVGTSSVPFKGVFDGNGYKINGLWINRPSSDYVGLFGYTNSAYINNITIIGNSVEGNNYTGLISGYSIGTFIGNCNISGRLKGNNCVGGSVGKSDAITIHNIVSSVKVEGKDYIGGIIGQADGQGTGTQENTTPIHNCRVTCDIIKGNNYIGGLCGANYGFMNHMASSYVYADILGNDYVGGICGQVIYNNIYSDGDHISADISNCSFWGNINANTNVGGISGEHSNKSTINNCSAICQINATGDCVGGIVGNSLSRSFYIYSAKWSATDILNSYFCGSIYGNDMVGGVVGYKKGGTIKCCASISHISGNSIAGGICGKAEEQYNNGSTNGLNLYSNVVNSTTISTRNGHVGRIWGMKQGNGVVVGSLGTSEENKAYNRIIIIDQGVSQEVQDGSQNGTGVSATTLKLKATYVAMGWDFTNSWVIQETECYPYFKTQTAPPIVTSSISSGVTSVSGSCVSGATITLEIDGVKQQKVSNGNTFTFTVDPLQAGHELRVSAKAEGKEQSYYTSEVVSFLGKGTEVNPYQISTAADLTQVYRKGYYKLMNDIDLTNYINQYSPTEGWESIGREGSETIHFDGNGHKITGLWCNSTRDNTGLFSCFANGYIKNLTVETAKGKQVKGGNYTGIIIGKLINGEMTNCKVTGNLADGTPVGGLMGKLDGGKVSRCQADVTINVTGDNSYIGGLIGEQNGEVDQCLSYGTLTATGMTSYVGGLVGLSNSGSSITNSYSSAITNSSLSAAGIVAYNYGVVDKCYAVGNVYSNNYGAGVVGYNDGAGAVVKNCVAMNNKLDVTFESQSAQSGGYGQRIIGGIKNSAPAPEMNNYALKTMQVSVNNVPQKVYDDIMNGTAKTAALLKAKATYQELGWDFNSIWKIEEGTSYPYQVEKVNVADQDEPDNPDQPDNPDNPDQPNNPETINVTDISNLTNAIYANTTSSQSNSETTLTICLKNAQVAIAYSFDLQLPEGVSLAKKSNGDYQYTLSNRHNGHGETVNYNSNSGVYSFAVISIQSKEIKGNNGEVLTLKLKVAANVVNGDYAIKILNAKYSIASGSATVNMPETVSKLTISQYKKGDVNNDGDVDIADAVCIVNHVVGIATPSFVEQAADVNGDGSVDISDAVRIINLIVGRIQALSRGNNSLVRAADIVSSIPTDAITANDLSVFAGGEGELTISMKNSQTTNAYSFDFELPEGVSIVQDEDDEFIYEMSDRHNGHLPTLNYLGNNTYSFATLSLQSKEIKDNEGPICTFKIKVDKTVKAGKLSVNITNAKYSLTSGASKVIMPETTGELTVKILGDANSNGGLSKEDLNAIVSHIMGDTPDNFDEDAADLNGDKKANAADIVMLIDLLGKQ